MIIDEMAVWATDDSPPPEGNEEEAQLHLELLRDHLGVDELGDLTPFTLRQLLLSVYPRKIAVADNEGLVDVLPTIRDLVRFAGDTGRLKADDVLDLQREIATIEPELDTAVMDPANWGMARSMVQKMLADGVDLSKAGEMEHWIDAYNSGAAGRPEPSEPAVPHELRRALGLPERLAPLRLPQESELAQAARTNGLVMRAAQLAAWAGDYRDTIDDELTAFDTLAAAQALGIPLPSETDRDGVLPDMPAKPPVKAMRDVPELRHLWEMAVEAGLIELCEGHVHVGANPADLSDDDDALDVWTRAFGYVLADWLPGEARLHGLTRLDLSPAGLIFFVTLFLAREPHEIADLREEVQEIVMTTAMPATARKAWKSWTARHGHPADLLLARLDELGAVTVRDGKAELTQLGLYGSRDLVGEMGVDVPLLAPTEQMSAADLVDAAKSLTEAEFDAEANAWLDLREPAAAARELLAMAESGSAGARLVASSIVTEIGQAAEPYWRAALDQAALRPYAKVALAKIAGLDDGETLPGAEPEPADAAWVLVDTVVAMADGDDEAVVEQFGQAVPPGQEAEMFDTLWRIDHPDVAEVLSTLGRVHPDRKIAKLARKTAFKARSRAGRTPSAGG